LAVNLFKGAGLAHGRLEGVKGLADAVDQRAGAAKIDRAEASSVSVAEAIVGAEGFAIAAAPGGVDGSLPGEELGAGGQ
jgi:hypothetical protein